MTQEFNILGGKFRGRICTNRPFRMRRRTKYVSINYCGKMMLEQKMLRSELNMQE